MKDLRTLISQVNSIEVLLYVYENPGANQRSIIIGEGQNSKRRRLKEFVDAGLISERRISDGRTNMVYHLTSDGEKFVKNWLILESGEDLPEPLNYDASSEQMDQIN